jgi:hypothetical protein
VSTKKKAERGPSIRPSGATQDAVGGPRARETFLTSTGVELILKRISPLLRDKVIAGVEWPEVPTYKAETASGVIEEHAHNETTLETDEDKAAWREYLIATARAQAESNERVAMLLFGRGIDYSQVELPRDSSWIAEQEELGVEVPKDPVKCRRHYVETELLASNDELKMLTLRLMAMSGADEEIIRLAEASFRGEVEGPPAGEPEDLEGTVELWNGVPEGEDGPRDGEER